MDSSDKITPHIIQSTIDRVVSNSVSFWWRNHSGSEWTGTGCILSAEGAVNIFTALHVWRDMELAESVRIGYRRDFYIDFSDLRPVRYSKKYDIIRLESKKTLNPKVVQEISKSGIDLSNENSEEYFYALCGYPSALVKLDGDLRGIEPLVYFAQVLDGKKSKNLIYLNYPKSARTIRGFNEGMDVLPEALGLSGSMIYRILKPTVSKSGKVPSDGLWIAQITPVAVQNSWREYNNIKASNVDIVL